MHQQQEFTDREMLKHWSYCLQTADVGVFCRLHYGEMEVWDADLSVLDLSLTNKNIPKTLHRHIDLSVLV